MTREEREAARTDLMLAQADVFYRPKDETIEAAIEALKQEPEPVYFPPCVDCHDRSKKILTAYDNMKKMQAYTKEEVITLLTKIRTEITKKGFTESRYGKTNTNYTLAFMDDIWFIINDKISELKGLKE